MEKALTFNCDDNSIIGFPKEWVITKASSNSNPVNVISDVAVRRNEEEIFLLTKIADAISKSGLDKESVEAMKPYFEGVFDSLTMFRSCLNSADVGDVGEIKDVVKEVIDQILGD